MLPWELSSFNINGEAITPLTQVTFVVSSALDPGLLNVYLYCIAVPNTHEGSPSSS